MSFLDKFLNVMRLNPDDDDDFYNEDYDYDDEEEEVKPKSSFKKREKEDTFTDDYKEKPVKTTPKVTPIRPSKKQQNLAVGIHNYLLKKQFYFYLIITVYPSPLEKNMKNFLIIMNIFRQFP